MFQRVLTQAQKKLALDAETAANFKHKGLRGNERAAALGQFLSEHLPSIFKTGKGEARDFKDRVSGELDLFVYDHATAAPIQTGAEGLIVPAEALYEVIEVKSILTADELDTCFAAAKRVRSLQPFKQEFISNPASGEGAPGRCRCPYIVFAYSTNLGQEDWAKGIQAHLRRRGARLRTGRFAGYGGCLGSRDHPPANWRRFAGRRFPQPVFGILYPSDQFSDSGARTQTGHRLDGLHVRKKVDQTQGLIRRLPHA